MTTAELLTTALRFYSNAGSRTIALDADLREKAHFFATKVAKRVWDSAPLWFRNKDGTVVLTSGVGTMPTDFEHLGTQGHIYQQNTRWTPLTYQPSDRVKFLIHTNTQSGPPQIYTFDQIGAAGAPKILCWPRDNSTLDILNYVRKLPELVDAPLAALLTAGVGTGLTGTFVGYVTFVTAAGETEVGVASAAVAVTNKDLVWSGIPTWWGRTVTARRLYRNPSTGGPAKLVTTINDNTTTTYTDTVADVGLGAEPPTPAAAVTGLEYIPDAFHESAIWDGLKALLADSQGDGRKNEFEAQWSMGVRRLWEEIQPGQQFVRAVPKFPGLVSGHPVWSRFTPPQG